MFRHRCRDTVLWAHSGMDTFTPGQICPCDQSQRDGDKKQTKNKNKNKKKNKTKANRSDPNDQSHRKKSEIRQTDGQGPPDTGKFRDTIIRRDIVPDRQSTMEEPGRWCGVGQMELESGNGCTFFRIY